MYFIIFFVTLMQRKCIAFSLSLPNKATGKYRIGYPVIDFPSSAFSTVKDGRYNARQTLDSIKRGA